MSDSNEHIIGELSTYLDRKLNAAETKRVDSHLKSCSACRRHFEELQSLRQMLRSGPSYTPPESFYQGVLHRIESPRPRASWLWGIPAKALVSACVVMLVVWVSRDIRQGRDQAVLKESKSVSAKKEAIFMKVEERLAKAPATPVSAPTVAPEVPAAPARRKEMTQIQNYNAAAEADKFQASDQMALKGNAAPAPGPTLQSKSFGGVRAKDVPFELHAARKGLASDDAALRELSAAPSQPLAKRQDVTLQARDINGAATQRSFDELKDSAGDKERANLGYNTVSGTVSIPQSQKPRTIITPPDTWYRCDKEADCTAVPELQECLCPCPNFVNSKYVAEYMTTRSQACGPVPSNAACKTCPPVKPVCVANHCTVVPALTLQP